MSLSRINIKFLKKSNTVLVCPVINFIFGHKLKDLSKIGDQPLYIFFSKNNLLFYGINPEYLPELPSTLTPR